MDICLAWLDCKVVGEFETGDHVVVFGEVTEGDLLREGDSSVHLRKDGLGYWSRRGGSSSARRMRGSRPSAIASSSSLAMRPNSTWPR